MKKKLCINTRKKLKKSSLSGLFPLLALCTLTGCSHNPKPSTELPTEQETLAETEPKTEAPALDEERLKETLRQLKYQYGIDFTFAHLPMADTETAVPETEIAEAENSSKALSDSDTDTEAETAEMETDNAEDGSEASSGSDTDTEAETAEMETDDAENGSEASSGSDIDTEAETAEMETDDAEDGSEALSDSAVDTETEAAETELAKKDNQNFPSIDLADLNGVPDPLTYYTLMDYRQLRGCPLPEPQFTIATLEQRLLRLTKNYSGDWSIYIKNLRTYDQILINDQPMKSASVMKLFIMGTVYEAMEEGTLARTQEVNDLLHNMITYSSNSDSNQLLYLLGNGSYADGIARVNRYIQSQRFAGETHEYNGFSDPATYTDPESFNQVSAKDCGRLLERIYRRTFGSRAVCNEVEEMMLNQDTRYKIPSGLPEETLVGNKTGEMDTAENDVAIVYGDKSDYILCVLSNDWDSKEEAISHIGEISSLVYQFFDNESYYETADVN